MVSTSPGSSSTTKILRIMYSLRCLTETSADIIFGFFFPWAPEKINGGRVLDESAVEEEAGVVRDTRRLLHIVGHNNNCIVLDQLRNQFFYFEGGDRVK